MIGDELPRQTRNHSVGELTADDLPDLSTMPDPRGLQTAGIQADTSLDNLITPRRDMLVDTPQPLPTRQLSDPEQQAQDFQKFFSALPVAMRLGMADQLPTLATHFMQQRQQAAQQVRAAEEQKRQHDIGLLEKAMTNPRAQLMLEQLGGSQGYTMAPQARSLAKAMKEGDYASFDAYKEVIPLEVQQRFIRGELPHHELTAWLDHAREAVKVNAKESAKAMLVTRAMNKKPEERTPHEAQLVEERQTALELKNADIELKHAQALKAKSEAEKGPNDRDLGIDREAFTLQEFGKKYGKDVRYRNLTQDEQMRVNRMVSGFQGEIQQSRTGGGIAGEMASQMKDPSQWRRVNDRGEIERVPAGMSKEEAVRSGFVNISQFDQEMKHIEQLPTAVSIIDDLTKYAREIMRTGPGLINRTAQGIELSVAGLRQAGRPTKLPGADGKPMTLGEVVELYDSVSRGNAEAMARAGGGLSGAATEGDVIRTLHNIAKTSDSVNVMEEKFKRFRKQFTDKYDRNVTIVFGKTPKKSNPVDERLDRIEQLLRQGK